MCCRNRQAVVGVLLYFSLSLSLSLSHSLPGVCRRSSPPNGGGRCFNRVKMSCNGGF
ncbi:hypothetical protein Hanom_Chr07g00619551 [Helianthus anomalus]